MSVLVTGATGFLGGHLINTLAQHGIPKLKVLVRSPHKLPILDAWRKQWPGTEIEAVEGNLLKPQSLEGAFENISTVYHLAAGLTGSPPDIWLHTVVGSKNLLDACVRTKPKRTVLISSFSVYGVVDMKRGAIIDEDAPLERHPERRDAYAFAKARQERLFSDYAQRHSLDVVTVRPGVIYGPGGGRFSTRVGLSLPGVLLSVGNRNILPLTFVRNCAEAIYTAAVHSKPGGIVNVVDDDLPTCREYLKQYRNRVDPVRYISMPYFGAKLLSRGLLWYNKYSQGQLPAVLTPYKVESLWKSTRFSNTHLKSLGWSQTVSTDAALAETFASFRTACCKDEARQVVTRGTANRSFHSA